MNMNVTVMQKSSYLLMQDFIPDNFNFYWSY